MPLSKKIIFILILITSYCSSSVTIILRNKNKVEANIVANDKDFLFYYSNFVGYKISRSKIARIEHSGLELAAGTLIPASLLLLLWGKIESYNNKNIYWFGNLILIPIIILSTTGFVSLGSYFNSISNTTYTPGADSSINEKEFEEITLSQFHFKVKLASARF